MKELRGNTIGFTDEEYDVLPTNANGAKIATGYPEGTQGEVYEKNGNQILKYIEVIDGVWYER